ncbi:MAG: septum formation initiator family protein [Calditrichaeota bacterium]|nr:septum formation initiator family protein [Calditrichota bacterium]MCB9391416.1 septum formation initiator family protein [Calditrichota bacterium]
MADWKRIARITVRSVLVTGLTAVGVWFYYGEGGIRDSNRLKATFAAQQRQIAQMELEKQELSSYLNAVRNRDEAAMELAARRYGLVGSNEYLWKITPLPADSTTE